MYRVLLVDDEPLILAGIKKKINWNALGFEIVGTAVESGAALRLIETSLPHLIVLDIRIPTMNGLEMMTLVKESHNCQFIVLSGFSDFNYAQKALQLGAIDYLVKPVAQSALFDAVCKAKKVLDAKRLDNPSERNELIQFITANNTILTNDEIAQRLGISIPVTASFYCVCSWESPVNCCSGMVLTPVFNTENTTTFLTLSTNGTIGSEKILAAVFPSSVAAIAGPFQLLAELPNYINQAQSILTRSFFDKSKLHFMQCNTDKSSLLTLSAAFSLAAIQQDGATCIKLLENLSQIFVANQLTLADFEQLFNDLIHALSAVSTSVIPKYLSQSEIAAQFEDIEAAISFLRQLIVDALPVDKSRGNNRQIALIIKGNIDKNFNKEFSLRELAEHHYMDMSYLSTVFKSEVGETFVRYISHVRINHAREMLVATDLSADQIARLCGYNNFSYFNKVFKRLVGVTPTEYRNCQK